MNHPSNDRKFSLKSAGSILGALLLSILVSAPNAHADSFDTLRLNWQNYLISNAGSAANVAATANGYLSSMDTSAGRTYLWSYLPLGSDSANLTTSYQQLEQMALAWAMPGSPLQGNASLAAAIDGGLDFICTNYYTPTDSEYGNWYDWEIGSPQALNNAAVLMYPASLRKSHARLPLSLFDFISS